MSDMLMQGPQFAKKYVTDYLMSDMPTRLVRYRNGWNVDDYTLPDPELYLTYEPIALDAWPTVITVVISTNNFMMMGRDELANPVYRVTYAMRTYVWVKTEGSEEVTTMRDRLTTVMRSALLDYPSLKQCDVDGSADPRMDESSLREEYSDLTLIKGDRVLAGAYLGYDLTLTEVVYRQPIGEISDFDLDVFNLRQ